jgi:hypothetical protein
MPDEAEPTALDTNSGDDPGDRPRCCPNCFARASIQDMIREFGREDDCDFCDSTGVPTVDMATIGPLLGPIIHEYEEVEPGVHYIPDPELGDAWDVGEQLDQVVEEDHPDLFSDRLEHMQRLELLQAVLDELEGEVVWDGGTVRQADGPWTRHGNELWAGSEYDDEIAFRAPPFRWQQFVEHIRSERRFVWDLDAAVNPRSYLTPDLLEKLIRVVPKGAVLFRAVPGGVSRHGTVAEPHPADRISGPLPEHCRRGGRVNPAGIPMLYLADDLPTVVAEVRPYKGAAVSVATLEVSRELRLVDFSPRQPNPGGKGPVDDDPGLRGVLETIGFEMAEPIDPDDSEIAYVPTQYVAEVVRAAGYDGLAFKSALGPGTNIVLFDLADAHVTDRKLHRVTDVTYTSELHKEPPF